MLSLINTNPKCHFIFYSNKLAWRVIQHEPLLKTYIACLNSLSLLNELDNKIILRNWIKTLNIDSSFLEQRVLSKVQISNSINLTNDKAYVIQESVSAGGEGAFLLNKDSKNTVFSQLLEDQLYSVSPYISGMSISCTIICHSDGVIIFPPNVQRSYVGRETDYRILFEGSDFVMGSNLSSIYNKKTNIWYFKEIW